MAAVEMAGGHASLSFRPCSLSENLHQSRELDDQSDKESKSFRTSCMACRDRRVKLQVINSVRLQQTASLDG